MRQKIEQLFTGDTSFTQIPVGQKPRGRWRLVSLILLLILLLTLIWWLFWSPYFKIAKVDVSGSALFPPDKVRAQLKLEGRNIWGINVGVIEKELARPEVATVQVVRTLPNLVSIVIKERQPLLIWDTTGLTYEVDSTGLVFREIARDKLDGKIYRVVDTANVHVELDQLAVPLNFMASFKLITDQLPTIYPDQLDHFEVGETVYDLDAVLRNGHRARFNILSDVAQQLAELKRIADRRPDLFNHDSIDLRVDRWAYIR